MATSACSGHFFSDDPPLLHKKNPTSRFQLFQYPLSFLFSTLLCSLKRQHLQSLYYRERFIEKHIKRKSDPLVMARLRSVCDIWPIIDIFFIWIDECKNDITWVVPIPRVNGITVILFIATFIRFTAVSACPVVILCQCPGVSQCWLASCERNLLLQAWTSVNCLCFLTLAALQMLLQPVALSSRLVLEHVVFEASLHLRPSQSFSFPFSSAIFFLLNSNTSFIKT